MTGPLTLMSVVNYAPPESDYRVQYPRLRPNVRVVFGTAVRPPGVAPADHVDLAFGERIEWRDVLTFGRLARVLRRRRYEIDLVHFYSTKLMLVGPLIAALTREPSIVTVTGFGWLFSDDLTRRRWGQFVYRGAFRVTTALARAVLFQNNGELHATVGRLPRLAKKTPIYWQCHGRAHPQWAGPENGRLRVVHVANATVKVGTISAPFR